jgi:pimeloyl-ACP methyl ester carboxylesterase
MLFTIIKTILLFLGVLYALLYFYQEKLLFHPQPLGAGMREDILKKIPGVQEISLTTPDGIKLHGWFYKPAALKKAPLVIYCGGNAEEVSSWLYQRNYFGDWAWAFINYRGYGLSEGQPGQKNFFSDALFIYDTFKKNPDILPDKIAVMGRSLGTGVAVYLAANRPVQGVILVSPYDSIVRLAQSKFPVAPISLLIKHPFESISYAPSIKAPLMTFIADEDTIVPPEHSMRLLEVWGGPKQYVKLRGRDHNTIIEDPQFWPDIHSFLKSLN